MCQYVNYLAVRSAANWHIDKSAHWQIIPIHDSIYKLHHSNHFYFVQHQMIRLVQMIKKQLITIQYSISQVSWHSTKFMYFNPDIYPFRLASDKQISPRVVFFPK